MNKKLFGIIVGIVIILGIGLAWRVYAPSMEMAQSTVPQNDTTSTPAVGVTDYKNATYNIDGAPFTLKDGVAETPAAPGSASMITTSYFGNEVTTDLNADGRPDIVFLLTQNTGGSGTFFYVVAAVNTVNGYIGSDAYLLGDRIAPQTTELSQNPQQKNVIVVNYMDRAANEPMTAKPTVGKSVYIKLDPATMQWGDVAQNFEGEADASHMSLTMKTWKWVNTQYKDGKVVEPKKDVFALTFKADGTFGATTDCNSVGGEYATTKSTLTFSKMLSTLMYCDGSQEADFRALLENTEGYTFTSKGELVLNLKLDDGSVYFR